MKTHITTIIAISVLCTALPLKAEEEDTPSLENSPISSVDQLKQEIKRQKIILEALNDRLLVLKAQHEKHEEFIIHLSGGQAFLMEKQVSLKEIELALNEKAEVSTSVPIIIRADKATPYSSVVEILDLCRKLGLSNVAFAKIQE